MNLFELKKGWEWTNLEGVANSEKNAIVDGPFGSSMKTSDYVESGVPVLQGKNVTNNQFRWFDVRFISDKKAIELQRSKVRVGDILMVKIGSIGYSAIVDDLQGHPFAIIPANLAKVTVNSSRIDKKYLQYWLTSPSIKEYLVNSASKTAQPALSLSKIKNTPVPLPPLPEQKRIAAILDKADSIRRKRQEAVRLTEELLRSVFLEMFGDPVTNPKGFKTGSLGDYCDMETGYAFKSEAFQKYGVRLCRGANVLPGELDWSDVKFWSNDSKLPERYILREGDIVLAMDRPWISTGLKVARVSNSDIPSYLVQRVARLRAIKGLSNEFIYFCIKHPYFMKHCVPKMTETTIPHISPLDIRSFPVLLPDTAKVRTFSKIALKVMQTESTLHKSTHVTGTLFNSLLVRAFNGGL